MDYNARFYSPKIGRFISADTIIPGVENPRTYDRFAYTAGNPVKYVDPSGNIYITPPPNNQTCGPDCGLSDEDAPTNSCDDPGLETIVYNGKTCYLVPVGNWHATTYIASKQSDSSNMPSNYSKIGDIEGVDVYHLDGSSDHLNLPFRFLYGAEGIIMAGNGVTSDGQWIYVDETSAQGDWQYTTCTNPDGTTYPCLDYYEGTATFYWGHGLTGSNQVPFQTGAVGPSYGLGNVYYIPALAALTDPDGNPYPGGGFILGNDHGGAIQDGDIDIYVGTGLSSAYSAYQRFGLSTSNETPVSVYKLVCTANIPR